MWRFLGGGEEKQWAKFKAEGVHQAAVDSADVVEARRLYSGTFMQRAGAGVWYYGMNCRRACSPTTPTSWVTSITPGRPGSCWRRRVTRPGST